MVLAMLTPADEIRIGRALRKAIEWISTIGPLGLGLVFVLAHKAFEAPLYAPLRFVDAAVWGALYLLIGAVRGVFLFVNGHYYPSPTARRIMATLTLTFVWLPMVSVFWIQAAFFYADGTGRFLPGAIGFPLLAAVEIANIYWLTVWLAHRRRQAGDA